MKAHPVAAWFPMLSDEELRALADDIRENGLLERIVVDGDLVLDGRNRLAACELAEVEPEFREWEGEEHEIIPWIISKNLHRRHLTESQRSLIAGRLATLEPGDNQHTRSGQLAGPPTQAEAASLLNVGERSVRRAREVLEHGSAELVEAVERGDVAVSAAAELVRSTPDPAEQAEVVRKGPAAVARVAREAREQRSVERKPWFPGASPDEGAPGDRTLAEPLAAARELRTSEPDCAPPVPPEPAAASAPPEVDLAAQLAALDPEQLAAVLQKLPAKKVRAAVRSPRREHDAYYTPVELARAIWRWLDIGTTEAEELEVLEPSVGGGAFAQAAQEGGVDAYGITTVDIDHRAPGLRDYPGIVGDFVTHDFGDQRFDLILGNPEYAHAEAHVRKAMTLLKPGGRLVFLLRSTFIGSRKRTDGLYLDHPLHDCVPVVPRPSFTDDSKTDSAEYAVFEWRQPSGDEGSERRPFAHLRWEPEAGQSTEDEEES